MAQIRSGSVAMNVIIPGQLSITTSQTSVACDQKMSLKQSAQQLLDRGFFIFPCMPGGKAPLGSYAPKGFKSAGNDESALHAWNDGIAANIGVACEGSNLTVIDCDAGFNSEEEALSWGQHMGFETLTVRTGRDTGCGIHFYFAGTTKSCDFELNGVTGQVKSVGGYVIGPGSVHKSGSLYKVIHEIPIAKLPGCFTGRCINTTTKTAAPDGHQEDLIPVGERRSHLLKFAGILVNFKLSEEGIYEALVDCLENGCEDGKAMANTDDADIRRIAADAATKWKGAPPSGFGGNPGVSASAFMTVEMFGFYSRALEQSKDRTFYFSGRTFAEKFQGMSVSTAYRRAQELENSGWFELIRKGGLDTNNQLQCTVYHLRDLEEWRIWQSQQPAQAPAISQTLTSKCVVWLKERLADGPVFSDELESERESLGYSRKTYEKARKELGVHWSQNGARRLSSIGNRVVVGSRDQKYNVVQDERITSPT